MDADAVEVHPERRDLRYISLGAGTQSSAMYLMSCRGQHGIPRADYAVFADTQDEPEWVYEMLEKLTQLGDIPIITVTHGQISAHVIERHAGERSLFAAIPAYTITEEARDAGEREGILRRQCTREYKIDPIYKVVRRLMGYRPRQHIKQHRAVCMIGISTDEAQRMKPSRKHWVDNTFPLIDSGLSRTNCAEYLESNGIKATKSACYFCPYRDDTSWAAMKEQHPELFARAVWFDKQIRDMSMSKVRGEVFLHRSCVPLDQVKFKPRPKQGSLHWDSFTAECEGMCGL